MLRRVWGDGESGAGVDGTPTRRMAAARHIPDHHIDNVETEGGGGLMLIIDLA